MMDGLAGAEVERRLHWFRLARELGQEDDFRALLDDAQRQAVEDYKRKTERT